VTIQRGSFGPMWPVVQSMSVSLIDGTLVNRWPTAWVGTGAVGQSVARIGEGPRHGGGSALLGEIISFVGGVCVKAGGVFIPEIVYFG
jgi:hypothetical protein